MRPATLAILALSLAACCNLGDKKKSSDEGAAANASSSAATPATAPTKARDFSDRPALHADAKDILEAYKNNEVRADGQYKDKIVEIRGKVGDVKKDITDSIYVTVGTGADFEIPEVQCFVKDSETKAAAALNKGDDVTVHGHVDGLLMNVLVKDCVIDPDLKVCRKVRAAIGTGEECEKAGGGAMFMYAPKVAVSASCAFSQKHYDLIVSKLGQGKYPLIGSTDSLCYATIITEKGAQVPNGLVDRTRKALDAL
jgi:hypothetical protein